MVDVLHNTNGLLTQNMDPGHAKAYDNLLVGLDVGSTTVKAVVMDPDTDEILWKDYESATRPSSPKR